MKFPTQIKVGAVVYKIVIAPNHDRMHEINEAYAQIDYTTREISLATKNSAAQNRDSLVHEIVHGITKHMGLDKAWGDQGEDYVSRISNGLNMVFRDNPEFVALLNKRKK